MTLHEDARSADLISAVEPAAAGDPLAARLEAALIESAQAIRTAEDRLAHRPPEVDAMLARCRQLHARARAAAARKSYYVADECLEQIERELVLAMDEEARRAALTVWLAEARAKLSDWQRAAAEAIAAAVDERPPPAAALQALMKRVHEARAARRLRIELARRQAPLLAGLLIGAVVFFALWALAGGFEWLIREDTEVTLAMVLVTGVLLGFFGALLSVVFGTARADSAVGIDELRYTRAITLARPFIGAALAVPIVMFLQSGVIQVGSVSLALALCFLAGFAERRFLAQVQRIVGGA